MQAHSSMTVLPMPYFGPLDFYRRLASSDVLIDGYEHYIKQSLRNRCEILGANGRQVLSIPVIHSGGVKQTMQEICIDHREAWRKDHWGAIYSAYGRSPYFIHYAEEIQALYEEETARLLDWNIRCHEVLCRLLGLPDALNMSRHYITPEEVQTDARPLYRKHHFEELAYTQVFMDRFSFESGLSMLDLLFCLGPDWSEHI